MCWVILSRSLRIPQNPRALLEARSSFIERTRSDNLSCLVCCEDTDQPVDKVMAVMAMELIKSTKTYDYSKAETKEMQKLNDLYRSLHKIVNPLKTLALPCYLEDVGLVVAPEYQSLGIAKEIIKPWTMVCKQHGVPLLGALITSAAARQAAATNNWRTLTEIDFKEFGRQNDILFQDVPATMHYMIKTVDQ